MSLTPRPLDGESTAWTLVDVNDPVDDTDDEDASSVAIISRASSPLHIHFQSVPPVPPIQILWPSTLPWFQLRRFAEESLRQRLTLTHPNRDSLKQSNTLTVGSRNLDLAIHNPEVIQATAKEISKTMPERFFGEHLLRSKTLVAGDPLEAKLVAFQILSYQLSNKLIEDPEVDLHTSEESAWEFNKYEETVKMFRAIDLPPKTWAEIFVHERSRTSSAFAEALFEAAINREDLEIIHALLDSRVVDIDLPVWSSDQEGHVCPIKWAALTRNIELVKRLVRLGADMEGSDDFSDSTIHIMALDGPLEIVRFLVENGADPKEHTSPVRTSCVENRTPLTIAAEGVLLQGKKMSGSEKRLGGGVVEDKEELEDLQELEGVRVFRYLLSLHDPIEDHEIIQDSMVVAAYHGWVDLVRMALAAGASPNEEGSRELTALQAALGGESTKRQAPMVKLLLEAGADPNFGQGMSPLHLAAFSNDAEVVDTLIRHGAIVNTWIQKLTKKSIELLSERVFHPNKDAFRKIAPLLHTPLDLALVKPVSVYIDCSSDRNALYLLQAGAELTGGELVRAVKYKSDMLVYFILERGADINESWNGQTTIEACLAEGCLDLAEILVRAGAKLKGGEVCAAFEKGTPELIDTFLSHGGRLDDRAPSQLGPLELACSAQNWDTVHWALNRGQKYSPGALCAAVCSTYIETPESLMNIRTLLTHRQRIRSEYRASWLKLESTAAGHAAMCNHRSILQELLPLGDFNTCFLPRTRSGYRINVLSWPPSWVLDAYDKFGWRDPDRIPVSIVVHGILSESWDIVQMLLDAGCKPDVLALLCAIRLFHNEQIVELLSAAGDLVNQRMSIDFDTPLQYAARLGKNDMVGTLLDHGADVNAAPATKKKDVGEFPPQTALQAAVRNGDQELIDLFLEAGADVSAPASQIGGATALQIAAIKGYLPIAKQLLELGAEVDAPRAKRYGRTALEGAAEHGRLDMVQFLLENGARTSNHGVWQYHRAIRFARRNGHYAVVKLLEDWLEGDLDPIWSEYEELLDDESHESDPETWPAGNTE